MIDDEIVKEIRRIREEYAAKFNYDLKAMFRDIKEREKESGRKHYDFSNRARAKRKRRSKSRTK